MLPLLIALASTSTPPDAPAPVVRHTALPHLRRLVGEEVEYDGYVTKAGMRVHVGRATFSVSEGEGPAGTIRLGAVAKGGKFGYSVRMTMASVLDHQSLYPREALSTKTGSEQRFETYRFEDDSIVYSRKEHCSGLNCHDPTHMITRTTWFGPIPRGSEHIHCPGCRNPDHFVWRIIRQHAVNEPFLDVLTALYSARGMDFEPGSAVVVPVVQGEGLWNVKVTSTGFETVKVRAGTFECIRIALDPVAASGPHKGRRKFSGLFGIKGNIRVWIDRETRLPVKIRGTLPFAFFNLYCEVRLRNILRAPHPATATAGAQ